MKPSRVAPTAGKPIEQQVRDGLSRRDVIRAIGIAAVPFPAVIAPIRSLLRARGTFADLSRPPDAVSVQTGTDYRTLRPVASDRWEAGQIAVTIVPAPRSSRVTLSAPADAIKRIRLRWHADLGGVRLAMGDAWERAYGDLKWRGIEPDRSMPWYALAWDGHFTHGYGVRTGPAAFCFWQIDPLGITLLADVRSGGVALQPGNRDVAVCEITSREGKPGESPFVAQREFCRDLCSVPRLPAQPVYGHNDWYYAYGRNSATSVLTDTAHLTELSPTGSNRPYVVIDDGWQPERGAAGSGAVGRWDQGNERFPDMAGLAGQIRQGGAVPGIWMRPLIAPADAPDSWRMSRARGVLDPTVAAVHDKVAADVSRLRAWGYQLIKHDYSTYDILGRWGRTMGTALTSDGWTFASGPSHTTAEVIGNFYRTIRDAAGDAVVIGCNTVSHLSAGVFEICRIGDDTSGTEWERVPRMGVNALAFRGAQHGAFYVADPDCVGVTTAIPWKLNRQWLDLLARSGTTLFVSLAPDALTAEVKRDVRVALSLAALRQPLAEPLDWQRSTWPAHWRLIGRDTAYEWTDPDGVPPPA
ncbi:MAG TPA: hypothetical protein VGL65_00455 [Gemmatimonadales bacterium]